MPATKERKKARKRLKKPRKFYTNAPIRAGIVTPQTRMRKKVVSTPKPRYTPPKTLSAPKIIDSGKIPKVITLKINTKNSALNKYGLPKGVTPNTLKIKHQQVLDNLINKGIKPSQVKTIDYNWKILRKAANFYNQSKKQETKDKWLKVINEMGRNITMLGFASSQYDNGVRRLTMKGVSPNSTEGKENRKRYYEALQFDLEESQDQYVNETGGFIGLGYDVEETDSIIRKMGSNWTEAYHKYAADVRRLVKNTGYSMPEYRQHFVNGVELGAPDPSKISIKKYQF